MRKVLLGPKHRGRRANRISTCRYSLYNFLPLAIYDFCRNPLNAFYIFIVLLQQIPYASPTWRYDMLIVLSIVFSINTGQTILQELAQWRSDCKINAMKCLRYSWRKRKFKFCQREDIAPGDVVMVRAGETVPVDMIVLRIVEDVEYNKVNDSSSCISNTANYAFISTAKLDGESSPKKKQCVQPCVRVETLKENMTHLDVVDNLGSIADFHCSIISSQAVVSVDHSCFVPAEADLTRNTGYLIGVAVYVGHECSFMIKSGASQRQPSRVDRDFARWQYLVILGVGVLSVVLQAWSHLYSAIRETYTKTSQMYVSEAIARLLTVLLAVPLSAVTTISLCRAFIASRMKRQLEGLEIHNSSHIDDLGAVSHMVVDKTGTLTENQLELKYVLSDTGATISILNPHDSTKIKPELDQCIASLDGPTISGETDIQTIDKQMDPIAAKVCRDMKTGYMTDCNEMEPNANQELYNGMALCHTIIPAHGSRPMHAESTDEVAILEGLERFGINVVSRNSQTMTLSVGDTNVVYNILRVLPFESKRMRMSIVVQKQGTDEIVMYTKGADVAINSIAASHSNALEKAIAEFASRGMRVLVYGRRNISASEWAAWQGQLQASQALPDKTDRFLGIRRAYDALEQQLTIIGATVIEDVLQQGAQMAVLSARQAGIHIWMATGDTHHTAIAVARDVGLVGQSVVYNFVQPKMAGHQNTSLAADSSASLSSCNTSDVSLACKSVQSMTISAISVKEHDLSMLLAEFEAALLSGPTLLAISGAAVSSLIETHATRFIALAGRASAVVCYRCNPAHKGLLVRSILAHTKEVCIAVGDGSNDVDMLGAASVGIAVSGSEGSWAHSASDVSLSNFGQIHELLLVHGSNAQLGLRRALSYFQYKASTMMAGSVVYMWFSAFSSAVPYSRIMYMNHNVGFTIFGTIVLAAYDCITTSDKVLASNPSLYLLSQNHDSVRECLYMLLLGTLQGVLHMVSLCCLEVLDMQSFNKSVFMYTSYAALLFSNHVRGWLLLRKKTITTFAMCFSGITFWIVFEAVFQSICFLSQKLKSSWFVSFAIVFPSLLTIQTLLYVLLLIGVAVLVELASSFVVDQYIFRAIQLDDCPKSESSV